MAPGCQNRSAAQISSGKTRYARLVSCENTSALTPIVVAASAIASSLRPGTRVYGHHDTATSRNGAISRSPPMSPSHQVRHTDAKPSTSSVDDEARDADRRADRGAHCAREEHQREHVPHTVERRPEVRDPMQQVRADDRLERVAGGDPDRRESGIPVHELARNAPSATPGQSLRPQSTSAASASPVGGQIAVTLAVSNAKLSPSLAAP